MIMYWLVSNKSCMQVKRKELIRTFCSHLLVFAFQQYWIAVHYEVPAATNVNQFAIARDLLEGEI